MLNKFMQLLDLKLCNKHTKSARVLLNPDKLRVPMKMPKQKVEREILAESLKFMKRIR